LKQLKHSGPDLCKSKPRRKKRLKNLLPQAASYSCCVAMYLGKNVNLALCNAMQLLKKKRESCLTLTCSTRLWGAQTVERLWGIHVENKQVGWFSFGSVIWNLANCIV